ncbi:MAG: RimK family alpha-L-glutamate ligase, partial [Polyangiaceae bacterium]
TFRFALRAQAEGLVVVDDPESILRCTNKVYLAELMDRVGVATPRTLVVHKQNINDVIPRLGLPCILKQPDSAFCQGVMKAETEAEFREIAARLLDKSELIVAQEYTPTEFDWRVGIFDGQPLYVCKYFMAPKHWQVTATLKSGRRRSGRVVSVPVDEAPPGVVKTALKAARAIGDGLYGVDLKQLGRRVVVMEVNDNPSIESPYEDKLLGDELYDRIIGVFLKRLEARQRGVPSGAEDNS